MFCFGRISALVMALCAAAVPGVGTPRAAEPPVVVASIKPVHDLATAVMTGIARPHLLLPPGTSPHTYALQPSAARALARADLILWIGPGLEGFLAKPIRTLGRKARSLALVEAEGMILLPAREHHDAHDAHDTHDAHDAREHDDAHDAQEHDDAHDAREHDDAHDAREHDDAHDAREHDDAHDAREHDEHGIDPHLWLDPRNGRRIARLVAAELTRLDPERAAAYRVNLTAVLAAIDRAETEARAILAPVRHLPYVVFHDAFQYFEKRFGTASLGAIRLSPERVPGARHVSEVRARIAAAGARCVFSEPQFEPAIVRAIVRDGTARAAVLDPLGDRARGYGGTLRAIARALRDCLAP